MTKIRYDCILINVYTLYSFLNANRLKPVNDMSSIDLTNLTVLR